jgi:hypothetical protein
MYVYKEGKLTQTEYLEVSNQGIDRIVESNTLYHLDKNFIARCAEIHFEIFGGFRPKINIPAAQLVMFKNLHRKINEYEKLSASPTAAYSGQVEGRPEIGETNDEHTSKGAAPDIETKDVRRRIHKRRN